MLGSIFGDIIGSTYEFNNAGRYDFDPFPQGSDFTDDTVLTVAVADAILGKRPYGEVMHDYARRYPNRGYGLRFDVWIHTADPQPYNSFGNGSAMRAGPSGWALGTLEETISEARKSAECTHNHPVGIKGPEAVAVAIFMARKGADKAEIKAFIEKRFHHDLSRTLEEINPDYSFNETCQRTVPEAISCFLESSGFEDAIRKAIWLGGDSDTLACITGGIAEAYYREMKADWVDKANELLPQEFRAVIARFKAAFAY